MAKPEPMEVDVDLRIGLSLSVGFTPEEVADLQAGMERDGASSAVEYVRRAALERARA